MLGNPELLSCTFFFSLIVSVSVGLLFDFTFSCIILYEFHSESNVWERELSLCVLPTQDRYLKPPSLSIRPRQLEISLKDFLLLNVTINC